MGTSERPEASSAAVDFYRLLARDPAGACARLAPGTRHELEAAAGQACEQALPEEDLPSARSVRHVEVYGKQALVELDEDVAFLARFDNGWRVTAAGCVPRKVLPYDCSVKGP